MRVISSRSHRLIRGRGAPGVESQRVWQGNFCNLLRICTRRTQIRSCAPNMSKFFLWPPDPTTGSLQHSPNPLFGLKGAALRHGRRGKRRGRDGREWEGANSCAPSFSHSWIRPRTLKPISWLASGGRRPACRRGGSSADMHWVFCRQLVCFLDWYLISMTFCYLGKLNYLKFAVSFCSDCGT